MFLLAGDIGGTKTILRLVEVTEVTLTEKSLRTVKEAQYISANFDDLVPIVERFLGKEDFPHPKLACFAIAGPVVNNTCNLTNLNWELSGDRLETELAIEQVSLINDFAANSFGILGLQDDDVYTLQAGQVRKEAPIAVIGAGTGLGEAFLIPQGEKYQIFASEGGHSDFAPRNDLEIKLWQYLQQKLDQKRISVERVVSGQGIVSIYQFLRDSKFAPESPEIGNKIKAWEQEILKTIDPAAIIGQAAFKKSDRLCETAISLFISAYGAEAGNLAIKLLPYGGVYIAGGIAAKILPLMQDGTFLKAFKDKGRVSPLLDDMPIHIVLDPQVGLVGSVLYALQLRT